MQLSDHTQTTAALIVDGNESFDTDLEVISNPDHPRTDESSRHKGVAKIVGDRRLRLNWSTVMGSDNVLELNLTSETLSFQPGLGSIPNRGTRENQLQLKPPGASGR
jgi:hypothetical protein